MTSCSLSSTFPQKKCSLVREHMETHCHLKGSLLRKMFQLFSRPCCIGRNGSTFPVCLSRTCDQPRTPQNLLRQQIHQKQKWSMEFCCSCFRVQMHKPLVHDLRCSTYHQGTKAILLELRRFVTLGGLGVPDSPNTTGLPPLVFQGSAFIHGSIFKTKIPPRQIPNPPNAIGCPPLKFTMRPSHVQGKQPHLQKAWDVISGHMRRRRPASDFCSAISFSCLKRWHHAHCQENQGCLLNAAQAVNCGDIGQRLTSAQGFHIYMFKEMTSSSFSSKRILSVLDFINNTMLSYIIQTFCFLSGNKCLAQSCTFNTLLVQASLFTVFAFKKFRRNCSRPVLVALLGKLWLPLALRELVTLLKLQQFIGDVVANLW